MTPLSCSPQFSHVFLLHVDPWEWAFAEARQAFDEAEVLWKVDQRRGIPESGNPWSHSFWRGLMGDFNSKKLWKKIKYDHRRNVEQNENYHLTDIIIMIHDICTDLWGKGFVWGLEGYIISGHAAIVHNLGVPC